MKSIKSEITSAILLICISGLIVLSLVTYSMSKNSLINESKKNVLLSSEKCSETINGWLEEEGKIVSELTDYVNNANDEQISNILQNEMKNNQYSTDIYLGCPDKKFIDGSGWTPPSDFDCTKRSWYINAIKKNCLVYSAPYLDANTNKMIVTISKPVIDYDGTIIGVIGCDVNINTIETIVNEAKPIQDSYAFLLDDERNFIIHPYKKFQPAQNSIQNVRKVLNGKLSPILNNNTVKLKDYDGKEKYFVTSKIKSSDWIIGFSVPVSEITKPMRPIAVTYLIVIILSLVFIILTSLYIGKKIGGPLLVLTKEMSRMSKFDLTYNSKTDYLLSYKDEIGKLAEAFSTMKKEFIGIIKKVKESSGKMDESSTDLSSAVHEISSKSENISTAVKSISLSLQENSASSEEITSSTQELNADISELSQNAVKGSKNAEKFKEKALIVRDKNKKAIEKSIKLYEEKKQEVLKSIEDGKVVNDINLMTDTILRISEKTNILSLNASIEAARAGKEGRGFAVVADEVKKLAQESKESVSNIKDTIFKVQKAFENISRNSESILNFVHDDINNEFELFGKFIEEYYEDTNVINKMYKETAVMSKELETAVSQVSKTTQYVAQNSQKSTEDSEEISESIEKTLSAIKRIASSAEDQSTSSDRLNLMVEKFRL